MKFNKQEKSWIMYDWANSVYATIVMTAIIPIFFANMANTAGQSGDYWWGIGSSVSMAIVAVMAPFIGAFADYSGYKMRIFIFFLVLGLVFTFLFAVTENWILLLIAYIMSRIGFSGGNLVYDSFLTDVTDHERMDRVSSYGYALGYIGGSTIPFLFSIALVSFGSYIGIGSVLAIKITAIITVLWWGIFSIPFVKNVKQKYSVEKPEKGTVKNVLQAVLHTARDIFRNKKVLIFILAYFFYIDGVGTIITMSTSYGAALGLDSTGMILALLVTQIVAVPCSIAFSSLSKKFGSLKMIMTAVCVYFAICIVGFIMGLGMEQSFLTNSEALMLFWLLAILVGTVQGGIQAISRSYFGKLIPPEKSGEYFGFFDIFGKFASVLGPGLYALTKSLTGSSAMSILSIVILFLIAMIILIAGRKQLA